MSILFRLTLFELFVGGGGRLTAIGPVSLRMVLFVACIGAAIWATLLRSRNVEGQRLAVALVLAYIIIHALGFAVGAARGHVPAEMWTELQASLYWLAAPYFAMELQSIRAVQGVGKLVEISGLMLAVLYVGAIAAVALGVFKIQGLLSFVANTEEFRNRGDGFLFYKGFLYLGIAAVFIVSGRRRFWIIPLLVVVCALTMTLTRGFLVSSAIATFLVLVTQRRGKGLLIAFSLMAAGSAFVWTYAPSVDTSIGLSRTISNDQRIDDIAFISNKASTSTLVLGEGFGSFINARTNIENTFLWALWKFGIIGLMFWLMPLAICTYFYLQVPQWHTNSLAGAYYFSTILVYVETATNPYLNNPIGLSFVLVAIFSLRTLAKGGVDRGKSAMRVLLT